MSKTMPQGLFRVAEIVAMVVRTQNKKIINFREKEKVRWLNYNVTVIKRVDDIKNFFVFIQFFKNIMKNKKGATNENQNS